LSKVTQIRQKARNFLQKGKYDKAIEEYKRLTGMETKNPNYLNELGDIYIKAGDNSQAVSSFEKAVVNYEKVALYNNAVAVCKKILRIIPGRVETIYKMGELRAKQKLEGEARSYFSQYLDSILADAESYGPELNEKILILLELVPEYEEIIAKAASVFKLIGIKSGAFELYCKLAADAERCGDNEKHQCYMEEAEKLRSSMTQDEIKGVEDSIERSSAPKRAGESAESVAEGEDETLEAEEPVVAEEGESIDAAEPEAVTDAPTDEDDFDISPDDGQSEEESDELAESAEEVEQEPIPEIEPAAVQEAAEEAVEEAFQEYEIPPIGEEETPSADMDAADDDIQPPDETAPPQEDEAAMEAEPARDETIPPEAEPLESFEPQADETEEQPEGDAESGGDFAEIVEDSGSKGEAEDLVEEITSDVEEDDHRSHYDLGMAYLEMALYTEAIKEFQIASRSEQLQIKSIEMIGHCFIQQNNPRLAVKQLKRGLEITNMADADNLGVHYNLGLAYEMLGEQEKAREHFEEVYIVDISFRDVAEKMKKFSSVS
jgi:tetratricopeptide (TPR) repeat protein